MRRDSENKTFQVHQSLEAPKPANGYDIETDRIQLAEAEAEKLWAELSFDLCGARFATAKVNTIRARLGICNCL